MEGAGLIFVGPTSEAIASMGSKIGAKRLLQAKEGSSVPLIPGSFVTACLLASQKVFEEVVKRMNICVFQQDIRVTISRMTDW